MLRTLETNIPHTKIGYSLIKELYYNSLVNMEALYGLEHSIEEYKLKQINGQTTNLWSIDKTLAELISSFIYF